MKIILGSQSKGRAAVLQQAGIVFETKKPVVDEKSIRHPDPTQLTLVLARAKSQALLKEISEPALLIASDQVVAWNGTILEKPETPEQARVFLQGYAAHPAETVTSVVVTNTVTGKAYEGTDIVRIWFHPLDANLIEELVNDPATYTYAGGFGIQDARLEKYIQKIEGAMDSVMGLPIELTKTLLKRAEAHPS